MHGRPLQHSPRPSSSIKRPTSKGEEMERVEGGGERERRGDEMVPPPTFGTKLRPFFV